METSQYMQAFLDESAENMQTLNTLCLQLEKNPEDDEVFAAMFRAAHTLKGMSATMGFAKMAALTHRLEDSLGFLRQSKVSMNSAVLDILFQALDALQLNLDELLDSGSEESTDHQAIVAQLATIPENKVNALNFTGVATDIGTNVLQLSTEVIDMIPQCFEAGLMVGVLTVEISPACAMKAVRAIIVMRELESLATCLQCFPEAEQMEQGEFANTLQFVVAVSLHNEDEIIQGMMNVSEITNVTFQTVDEQSVGQSMPSTAKLQMASTLAIDNAVGINDAVNGISPITSGEIPSNALVKSTTKSREKSDKIERTVRVSVDRLDALMNMLSELVIDRTRLADLAEQIDNVTLRDAVEHLSRVSADIQSSVMALRMVPVDSLFQRFPRMIRDLSKSLGKEIKLEMSGLDTEFDRTVIDEMGEALVHLIRNAADHGLESTENRLHAGKPAFGTIHLSAYASGQSVFIEVEDDGGGIDRGIVLKRAIKNHLVQAENAHLLSDNQVQMLLFESGFSTAEAVSDISGRGVGLDAVKRKVESLGGRIEIESILGKGTLFRVRLPLTLAIMQALLVEIVGEIHAIPLANVEEVFMAEEQDLTIVHGHTVLNYRNHLVPIIDAGQYLVSKPALEQMPWNLLIVKEGNKRVAIGINEFHGQQEIVNKSLGSYLANQGEFAGATILGDGKIALIFDVHHWMQFNAK